MNFKKDIDHTFELQKTFFDSGKTAAFEFRKSALQKLKEAVFYHKKEIEDALFEDLGKKKEEVAQFEIAAVITEIDYALENLESWMNEDYKEVPVPESFQPSKGYIKRESFGVCYIIGPFNYPVNLTFSPLVGAIIGGNTAIVKPSENNPKTSKVIEKIINNTFPENYIRVYQGAVEENTYLLSLPFDFIFFTGSPTVGKIVMEAASKHLTPFVLELGGKSPFIVEQSADLEQAAEQLLFGKLVNSGQTCIAPDYVYIDKNIKNEFIAKIAEKLSEGYMELGYIGKIVSQKQTEKLSSYLKETTGDILLGGKYDIEKRFFQPTIVDNVHWDDVLMKQELFGPIIPILTFDKIEEVPKHVNKYTAKPLALYIFTKEKEKGIGLINSIQSGDAQINGVFVHAASPYFPFGGVGSSGIGEYHGKYSYEAFTHKKSIRIVE